jgi:hypothetical protein
VARQFPELTRTEFVAAMKDATAAVEKQACVARDAQAEFPLGEEARGSERPLGRGSQRVTNGSSPRP